MKEEWAVFVIIGAQTTVSDAKFWKTAVASILLSDRVAGAATPNGCARVGDATSATSQVREARAAATTTAAT